MEKEGLTRQIIGCCFAVHRELGPGFHEKIYHTALQCVLRAAGIVFESQKRFQVTFQGVQVGEFSADLVVGHEVVVELKAISGPMPKVFQAQLLSYLKASSLHVGLLVNFGNTSCHVKRLVL